MQQDELSAGRGNQLLRAIAERRWMSVTYNGKKMCLEPHLLFFRHGEPYLLAKNTAKQQASGAAPKLGQFKLAGLTSMVLEAGTFVPAAGFDGQPPRGDDAVVTSVIS